MLNKDKGHQCVKPKPKPWNQNNSSFDSVEDKEAEGRAIRVLKEFQEQEDSRGQVKGKKKPDTDTKKFS